MSMSAAATYAVLRASNGVVTCRRLSCHKTCKTAYFVACHGQDAAGRGSVKLVQVKGSNSDWESMNNVWGASWESTSVPAPPLDFRIQDDAGVEVSQASIRSHPPKSLPMP